MNQRRQIALGSTIQVKNLVMLQWLSSLRLAVYHILLPHGPCAVVSLHETLPRLWVWETTALGRKQTLGLSPDLGRSGPDGNIAQTRCGR